MINGSTPDLIILDVMFPELGAAGLELAGELRRQGHTECLPILIVSAVDTQGPLGFVQMDRSMRRSCPNASDFIEKPVDLDVFLAKVQLLLDEAGRNP